VAVNRQNDSPLELLTGFQLQGKPSSGGQNKSKIYLCALAIGLVAALTGFSACSNGKANQLQPKQPQSDGPVPVAVATVTQKTVPVQIRAIGTAEAYSTVAVKAQIEGTLTRVHFKEGQDVKAGDLLFTIDSRPYETALAQAEANLARDRIETENAKRQAERDVSLFKKGVLSEEERDQSLTKSSALEAAVRADIAAVETAKVRLSYCTIQSPLDGRTGDLKVHEGNLVKNDIVLVVINQVSPTYAAFSVPEQNLAEIRKYMAAGKLKVEASIPDQEGPSAVGELSFVDNTVDTELGTILLKATFPNRDGALWPGQFVNVTLTLTNEPDRIVVPAQAIQSGQQDRYVYVVTADSKAEFRPVVVERSLDGQAVVEKGLEPGEKVVTDGQLRLVPGAMVEVKDTGTTQGVAP